MTDRPGHQDETEVPDYSQPGPHHDDQCERRSGHEWPYCHCKLRRLAPAPAAPPEREDGMPDELGPYLARKMREPGFRAAYEAAERELDGRP